MSDVRPPLLREILRDQPAPPSSACLDVETLAAWFDGALRRRERAMVESHASACARCQAMLAAIAKTAAPSVARTWWQTMTFRWLMPIVASSAAAVVLWMKTPEPRPAPALSSNQPSAVVDAPTPAPSAVAELPRRKQTAAGLKRPVDSKDTRETLKEARPESITANAEESVAAPQEQPGAATAVERDARAAAPPAAAPQLRSDASSRPAPSAAKSLFGFFKEISAPLEILSPDPNFRWRIVTGGGIEHSTDGGSTWQLQPTDAAGTLTTGVAPAPAICWLVGRAGTVLLSTDGRTWQRVAFPETIDLVAIRASDGANATVMAANGRTFATIDGGKTWR